MSDAVRPRPAVDVEPVAAVLREAAETHHRVYRITDGDDPDWATWYATWLVELSELPRLLGRTPVRSELVHLLVELDRETAQHPDGEPWDRRYARRIAERLSA
jgi:hypothetical protein